MKKTFLYGAALFSLSLSAQQQLPKQKLCGFDQLLEQQDKENPGAREALENIARKIQLEQKKNPSAFNKTVNGIYEIPVVVHVIEGGDGGFSRTNAQIQTWIENANKMYAGTYPWPSNGVPADFGTAAVFPIRLVLAKRTPQCTETTGIVRYNGSSLPGYSTSGMAQQTANGATRAAIKGLAPHWPESSYFNIYLINMFDGDPTPNAGLMGFAAFPNSQDSQYESFMKAGTVSTLHDTTFAHEFGHAMGLYHTFQGGNYQVSSSNANYCPPATTGDCTKDNDMVCDTERAGAAYFGVPPTNAQTNPCTSTNYQGVQYNMMNYTNSIAQKFTLGQGDKIQGLFMLLRSSLTTSPGGTPISTSTGSTTPIAACAPTGVTNMGDYLIGPTSVKLGQINNASSGLWTGDPSYYVDYTLQSCLKNSHTTLAVNQPQTIEVEIFQNPQFVRVWIDYNNNGLFEESELVASGDDIQLGADLRGLFTGTFTPPSTAVMNTPLRMRVIAEGFDEGDPIAFATCGQLNYGQAEDYSVTLVSNLGTSETKANNNDLVIYPNPVATGDKIFIKAKNGKNLKVSISDMAGRVVANPTVSQEENGVYKVSQQLEKGVYMIQVSNGKDSKTSKLIIK
ncbi:T9SS C-terminal target domain-containing protein [Chryseobacterium sp. G0162]|uniref:T9SS type A sorting domain-containing protein n=1 Tax=Chryseobacterium sp. G0162 TaxID=2487063 RepID=UPI000F4F1ED1|nr:T9SS type A sorting domain-containing protein [Chryseobacterium sp. G0162]AZB09750.1 T9SS C-terminal target domain-containing protein [Chryseobacterium sp. G0162]